MVRNIMRKALDLNIFRRFWFICQVQSHDAWSLECRAHSSHPTMMYSMNGLVGPAWTPGNANAPYTWLWNVFWEGDP